MKKFVATLILLLLLGGAAFFFGWAQAAVPPGSWGVLRSKTHGLDKKIIREGEFRWIWYKLIPTNVKILVFSPERVSRSLVSRGELPSGDVYAAFTGASADFSWEAKVEFSFNISPFSLPVLVEEKNITGQEDFRVYSEELADEIHDFILRWLRSTSEELEGLFPGIRFLEDTAGIPGPMDKLEMDIFQTFPNIENFSCRIHTARFPDFHLYRSLRASYEGYLEKQREFLSADISRSAENKLISQLRFDELEKYGELLTKYPVLLQYLAMESGYTGPITPREPASPADGD